MSVLLLHPGHLLHPPLGHVHLGPGQAPWRSVAEPQSTSSYPGTPSLRRYMGAQHASSLLLRASGQEHGEEQLRKDDG